MEEADADGDGIPDFCDNCPTVFGEIGDFCDSDPGPGVAPGALDATCTCVPVPCTENIVVDICAPDGNSDEASFEIFYEGTPNARLPWWLQPGLPGWYHHADRRRTAACPWAATSSSCMTAVVMVSLTGGYEVREAGANGRRIIDNTGNFSTGSVSAIANGGTSACRSVTSA